MIGSHRFYSYFVVLTALLTTACAPTESNAPRVQLATVSAIDTLEGDSGQSTLTFRVSSDIEQRVRYQTSNITAAANSDYFSQSGEWLMQPGVTRTVDIPVLGDTQVEADEVVGLLLTYDDGSSSQHQGSIINDDRPLVSVTDQRLNEGAEDTTVMRFTLELSQTTLTNFPVRVRTDEANQTQITATVGTDFQPATANSDYLPTDFEITFPPGANKATAEVEIVGDTDIEAGEAFLLSVFDASNDPATDPPLDSAFGLIINDDGPGFNMPMVTFGNAQGPEGPENRNNTLTFPVVLNGPNEVDFSIFYEVVFPSSASGNFPPADSDDLPPPSDEPLQGKFRDITANGETLSLTDNIQILVTGDNDYELDEYFELVLTTENGYELARAQGIIQNDDTPRFTLTEVSQNEGDSGKTNLSFTLTWDEPEPVAEEIRLKYRTLDGFSVDDSKATSGPDYDYTNGTVTFLPGDTSKTINVPIIGDTRYEPNEALTLQVNTESGTPVVSARGVIVNDDNPELKVTPTDGTTVNEDSGVLEFNAEFERAVTQDTTLYYVIDSGSAIAGLSGEADADVSAPSLTGTAFYRAGGPDSDDMSIPVTVMDDLLVEQTESFAVTFYASQQDADNQRSALYQSTISIIDNDVVLVEFSRAAFGGQEGNVTGEEVALKDMASTQANPTLRIYNGILPNEASISLSITDTGTTESNDYRFIGSDPAIITIPAGDYSAGTFMTITEFVVVSDTMLENDETLTLGLSNLTAPGSGLGLGAQDSLEITIENDDLLELGFSDTATLAGSEDNPAPLPSLQAITAVAGDYNPDGPGGDELVVALSLVNAGEIGQAENEDFTPALPALLTITDFPIEEDDILPNTAMPVVVDDNLVELEENASIQLTSNPGALTRIDTSRDRLDYTITSDDRIQLTLQTTAIEVDEGSLADIPITIAGGELNDDSPALPFEITVTADTGTENADFNLTSGEVTVPGNQDYSTSVVKTDWLDAAFELRQDGIVENTETLTIGLGAIEAQLGSVLAYSDGSATVALSIIDNDTLSVGFTQPDFESYENEPEPGSAIIINGTTEIDVTLEFLATGSTDYPAGVGSDITVADVIIEPSHTTGDTYTFPAIINTDTNTEFNEQLTMQFKTGAQTGETITLIPGQEDAKWLILNDDSTRFINGSGIDYCADAALVIDTDCDNVMDPNLQTQDGKLSVTPFDTSPPSRTEDDAATAPLTWNCITDSRTHLSWAFEDSTTPRIYTDTEVDAKITEMTGVCGNSDWRRPTFSELTNLMIFTTQTESGLLDTSVFTDVQIADSTDQYWFKESDADSASQLLSFHQGQVAVVTSGYLMLVSDDDTPLAEIRPTKVYACAEDKAALDPSIESDHRYTVSGEEITDNLTGLTWAARSLPTSDSDANPTWSTALAQASNYGTDWRAPTIKELLSLVTLNCNTTGVAVDSNLPHFFLPRLETGTTTFLPLMSSSPVNNASGQIWTLNLNDEASLLAPSAPPSSSVHMQTFVVNSP